LYSYAWLYKYHIERFIPARDNFASQRLCRTCQVAQAGSALNGSCILSHPQGGAWEDEKNPDNSFTSNRSTSRPLS
jgi:hypothetical protein